MMKVVVLSLVMFYLPFVHALECRYQYHNVPTSWPSARSICESRNRTLLRADNPTQIEDILELMNIHTINDSIWIGLHKEMNPLQILQDDCEEYLVNATDWKNESLEEEGCVTFDQPSEKYIIHMCSDKRPFICESKANDSVGCYEERKIITPERQFGTNTEEECENKCNDADTCIGFHMSIHRYHLHCFIHTSMPRLTKDGTTTFYHKESGSYAMLKISPAEEIYGITTIEDCKSNCEYDVACLGYHFYDFDIFQQCFTHISMPKESEGGTTFYFKGNIVHDDDLSLMSESMMSNFSCQITIFDSTRPSTTSTYKQDRQAVTDTTSKGMLPNAAVTSSTSSPFGCRCPCSRVGKYSNMTMTELQRRIKELKEDLKIDKKTTSQYKNKLISAADKRASAQGIGCISLMILIFLVGMVVCSDLPILLKHVKSAVNFILRWRRKIVRKTWMTRP